MTPMNRRDLMTGAGLMMLAASVSARAGEHDHKHHDMAAMPGMKGSGGAKALATLAREAGDCAASGEACLAHCLVLLGEGDKAMAECARSVNQMMAVCTALQKLALQQAPATAALAKLARDVCLECEKSCRKHEKHDTCRDCAEHCARCAKACEALTAG